MYNYDAPCLDPKTNLKGLRLSRNHLNTATGVVV